MTTRFGAANNQLANQEAQNQQTLQQLAQQEAQNRQTLQQLAQNDGQAANQLGGTNP